MLSDVQPLIMKRKAIFEVPPAAISSPIHFYIQHCRKSDQKWQCFVQTSDHDNNNNINNNKITKSVMAFNLKSVNVNLNL